MSRSAGEELLAFQLKATGIAFEREVRFDPKRRWRFDFALCDHPIAIEVEGGSWSNGRHTRGAGFAADLAKYNRAAIKGWVVLRYTPAQVKSGAALEEILSAVQEMQAHA